MRSNLTKSDAQWKRFQSLTRTRVSSGGFAHRPDARIRASKTRVAR